MLTISTKAVYYRFVFILMSFLGTVGCQVEVEDKSEALTGSSLEVRRVCEGPSFPNGSNPTRASRSFLLSQNADDATFIGLSGRDIWIRESNFDRRQCFSIISPPISNYTTEATPVLVRREITQNDLELRRDRIEACERLNRSSQRRQYGSETVRSYSTATGVIGIDTGDFVGCEILVDNYSVAFRALWGDLYIDVLSVFDQTYVMNWGQV